jgi:hypothetical protein
MALIVPGVCRYTVNGTFSDRPVANIIDMRIDTTGTATARSDAVQDQAGIILNEWSDHVLVTCGNRYTALSVSWVDLDDADGSTGLITEGEDETWPQAGLEASSQFPGSVNILVTKVHAGGRQTRNGRMYLAGVAEAWTAAATPQAMDGTFVTAWQTNMDNLLDGINTTGSVFEYDSFMCVVHITERDIDGNPTEGNSNDVTALTVNARLATQRRRLRG